MYIPTVKSEQTVIGDVIAKFVAGDPTMFDLIAEDIDFRIDHFRDDADVSWQQASSRESLIAVVQRLGQEIFPKGTHALGIDTFTLGNGWYLTRFKQLFYYGLQQRDVTSVTYITSHESDGVLDFFRETVTNVLPA